MANFDAERRIELQQIQARLKELKQYVYTDRQAIGGVERCVTGLGRGPEPMPAKGWEAFALPGRWGGYDQTTWFRMTARIPKRMQGQYVVALIRPGQHTLLEGLHQLTEAGDSLAYVNGKPFQGIDRNHEDLHLAKKAQGGEQFDIAIEICPSTRFDTTHEFAYADLAVFHQDVWDCYWDFQVPLEAFEELDPNFAPARQLQDMLAEGIRKVDLNAAGTPAFYKSVAAASKFVRAGLKQFETSYGMGHLTLVGHSHIDTAWLWPLRETQRKVGRTFSTVLRLMERYPDYHFSCSQPELYMYVKEHHPEVWTQIKKRVKEGRWEPCGAPWIEQDSNMPSGESLIRQFLYGNRFFEQEFGMRSRTAWLPDAFGYPWTLPQILKKSGIDTFVTTKIDWSMFTPFPYSMFQWQGTDGTRMYTVMPPLNYNGNPRPKDLRAQWNLFRQKEKVDELPFPFGFGDGGGGPTAEMLEYGKRAKNLIGLPRCDFGRTQDSLDTMHKQCPAEQLPVYNGELYLELHRACQTTQARTKRNNRKVEVLLHDTELLSSLALLQGGAYDGAALWQAWRTVLTHQFHDILPGSSIGEVYTDADRNYAEVARIAGGVQQAALQHLTDRIDTRGEGTPVVVFNTLSWVRSDIARVQTVLPKGRFHIVGPGGVIVPHQKVGADEVIFEAYGIPALGHAVYRIMPGAAKADVEGGLEADVRTLENEYLRVKIDTAGRFSSVFDKVEGREVLAAGQKGNVLQFFEDRPHLHDAWDIDHNFDEEKQWDAGKPVSITLAEAGPVRAVVRVVFRTGKSTITQDITLYALQPRVDVATHVDWQEKRTLLKAAFPVDVLSPRATYHIQFGTIERATHANTAHDRGRFEVTAHHWADLSEGDYGVSLLNDCKYGYDVKDNVLRISLLRASVDPDPHADEGHHDMTYSLYPHGGDWRHGTVQQGYELNTPLLAVPVAASEGPLPPARSFASIDADHVIIEHVKKAEDSKALVMRVYEAYGQRGTATITFAHAPKRVVACDMMEEQEVPVALKGNELSLRFTPNEIKTLKVTF